MPQSIFKDITTLSKNVTRHAGFVLRRRESVRDALSRVASDAKKLRKHAGDQHGSERRKAALKFVKQGREAYNAKNDALAEKLFRDAVVTDEHCALAHAYLGNALYRQGKTNEAETNWRQATIVEPNSEGAKKALHSLQRLAQKRQQFTDNLKDGL
ncbi:MAG: tetratricopeptide repeat protein [Candidatus Hydrogenedentota bacterium]